MCGLEKKVPTFVPFGIHRPHSALASLFWALTLLFSHVLFDLAQKMNGHFLQHKTARSLCAFSSSLFGNHHVSAPDDLLCGIFENRTLHRLYKLSVSFKSSQELREGGSAALCVSFKKACVQHEPKYYDHSQITSITSIIS